MKNTFDSPVLVLMVETASRRLAASKAIFLLLVMCGVCFNAPAQTGKHLMVPANANPKHEMKKALPLTDEQVKQRRLDYAEKQSKYLQKELSLSPEQYKKVYEMDLDFLVKIDEQKGKQITKETEKQMQETKLAQWKQILTAEQYATYEAKNNELAKGGIFHSLPSSNLSSKN